MTISADRRGWGRGWPQNNAAKMVTIKARRSGVTLLVHRDVAPILKFCIDTVEDRGYLFDHGPKDVNDDWGYVNRPIRGTSIPSNHSWGLAIDLDAQEYPQGQRRRRPPQWVDDVFAKYRFDNGAPWKNPDPMHYEFNGTPADARFLVASLAGHAVDKTPAPMPPSAAPPPPVAATPPPYVGPVPTPPANVQEDDMHLYVFGYATPEYWLVYGDGFARNLNQTNGESAAWMRVMVGRTTLVSAADSDHVKTGINELSYDEFKARRP